MSKIRNVTVTPGTGKIRIIGHAPTVRGDAIVTPSAGRLAITGFAPEVVVTPAPTSRGRADQLTQLRAELPQELAARWGLLLDAMVAELRGAGRPPKAREQARKYIEAELAKGRKVSPALKREAAAQTGCDMTTVRRAIKDMQI